MNRAVGIDNFASEIEKMLSEYGDEAQKALEKSAKNVAKETAKRLKSASPKSKHSGRHYANGWRVKDQSGRLDVDIEVYNATKPGLTHLLENGHALRGGGWQSGQEHIRPVEEWAIEALPRQLEKELKE